MKKLFLAVALVSAAAFAALDFGAARTVPVLPSATSVGSGATNETVLALGGLRGVPELFVVSAGSYGRTALNVTLWATNAMEGGWTPYVVGSFAATNAGVFRVAFPGEFLTKDAKVTIGSVGAASSVTAFILTY